VDPSTLPCWILECLNESKPKLKPPVIQDSCSTNSHLHEKRPSIPSHPNFCFSMWFKGLIMIIKIEQKSNKQSLYIPQGVLCGRWNIWVYSTNLKENGLHLYGNEHEETCFPLLSSTLPPLHLGTICWTIPATARKSQSIQFINLTFWSRKISTKSSNSLYIPCFLLFIFSKIQTLMIYTWDFVLPLIFHLTPRFRAPRPFFFLSPFLSCAMVFKKKKMKKKKTFPRLPCFLYFYTIQRFQLKREIWWN
jgi:hypothetical protein